jgi:predicted TIM-barrel fold metal-dependent hydrolase
VVLNDFDRDFNPDQEETERAVIIDCHTHLFPKWIREQRETYFSSEPAFRLLYESPKSRMIGADGIVSAMDEDGVDRSVIFGFPWQNLETCRRHNDYILSAVEKYPQRLSGFCCVDPHSEGAVDEAARCLDGGLCGVGELAFYGSGISPDILDRLKDIMALCRDRQTPVTIHTNECVGHVYPGKAPIGLDQLYALAKSFPENRIILAHWGGGIFFFNLLKKEVKETLAHVYFDTAASPFLYDPAIYSVAVQLAGVDKVLFGSDFPLIKPGRYFREMNASGLPETDIQQICGENCRRLLNL